MAKMVPLSIMIVGIVICVISSEAEISKELRTWTLIDDKVWNKIETKFLSKEKSNTKNKLKANLISKGNGKVRLKLTTGERISLSENALSVEDRNFLIPAGGGWRPLGRLLGVILNFWASF